MHTYLLSKDKATYMSQIEMSSNVTPSFIRKIKATKANCAKSRPGHHCVSHISIGCIVSNCLFINRFICIL